MGSPSKVLLVQILAGLIVQGLTGKLEMPTRRLPLNLIIVVTPRQSPLLFRGSRALGVLTTQGRLPYLEVPKYLPIDL